MDPPPNTMLQAGKLRLQEVSYPGLQPRLLSWPWLSIFLSRRLEPSAWPFIPCTGPGTPALNTLPQSAHAICLTVGVSEEGTQAFLLSQHRSWQICALPPWLPACPSSVLPQPTDPCPPVDDHSLGCPGAQVAQPKTTE